MTIEFRRDRLIREAAEAAAEAAAKAPRRDDRGRFIRKDDATHARPVDQATAAAGKLP